jgi:hypothetical protein
MMMLSAIVLLIGFVALAGMVSRVNQLGSKTTTESHQTIIDEVTPLQAILDSSLSGLAKRVSATNGATLTSGSTTVTMGAAFFAKSDVGLLITGTRIPANTIIVAVASSTQATMGAAASSGGTDTITVRRSGFALDNTASTPPLDAAIVSMLQQLERVEKSHGFWMDYQVTCGTAGANSVVVMHLTDGNVWVQVSSTVLFQRASSGCVVLTG